jgi:hypothetical protein
MSLTILGTNTYEALNLAPFINTVFWCKIMPSAAIILASAACYALDILVVACV